MTDWRSDESAVRQVIRLTRAVSTSPADSRSRRQRMVVDLCHIMQAPTGVSAVVQLGASQTLLESIVQSGTGETGKQMFQWLPDQPLTDRAWSRMMQMLEQGSTSVARTRPQLLREDRSDHSTYTRRTAGADHDGIFSAFRLTPTAAAVLSISRRREKNLFTPADARLVHLIHSELEHLYNYFPTSSRQGACHLTPRQQEIHEYLLKGQGEKQIAATMGLSKHTVHAHIKAIYKYFRVTSRPELLARFVRE